VAETASKKTADNRPRLLLMDGHSLAYRAFFALPAENFTTAVGQPTNAIYGFTSMLANTVRDEAPTHLAVAFDVSRKTFRFRVAELLIQPKHGSSAWAVWLYGLVRFCVTRGHAFCRKAGLTRFSSPPLSLASCL
jgi:hypothetical protein